MDPVSLIVAALVAGAVKGVGETAAAGVKDAYGALRSRLGKVFEGRPTAQTVLAEHEQDPQTYAAPLAKEIERSGAAESQDVLEAAKAVLAAADPDGTSAGRYHVGSISADRGGVAAAHIEGGVAAGYHQPPQDRSPAAPPAYS
jgi:hypothetical protein